MNRKLVVSILAIILALAMVLSLVVSVIPFTTGTVGLVHEVSGINTAAVINASEYNMRIEST